MTNPADAFFGGAQGLSWPKANNGVYTDTRLLNVIRGGVITDEPTVVPMTEMNSGKPITWPDGRPKEQLVVTLRCDGQRQAMGKPVMDERDPANPYDDGKRRLYVRGYLVAAIKAAMQQAGAPGLRAGGELYVVWTGQQESKTRGFDPARTWAALYVPPTTPLPQGGANAQPGDAAASPWGAPPPAQQQQQPAGPPPAQAPPSAQQPVTVPAGPPPAASNPWGAPPPAQQQPVPAAANPWATP